MNIVEGMEIVNSFVGIILDSKNIESMQEGKLVVVDKEKDKVVIEWLDNKDESKNFQTEVTFEGFSNLVSLGLVIEKEHYVETPDAKFEKHIFVSGLCVKQGVIKSMYYDKIKKSWLYKVIDIDATFKKDYELCYTTELEKDLKEIEKIDMDLEFKDRQYNLKIEKQEAD